MANMIAAGKLRHRVTIQKPPTTRNSFGRVEAGASWVDVADWSCDINVLRGNERDTARQQVATATHKILMRKPRAFELTTKHRLKFGTRIFEIGYVPDLEELGFAVELLCSEAKP